MQQLQFENSWDKAIAPQDKKKITHLFETTKSTVSATVTFSPIAIAKNYKGDLLVTVLVHNGTTDPFALDETAISYKEDKAICTFTFTQPAFVVPAYTSMPWTFIFPANLVAGSTLSLKGELALED